MPTKPPQERPNSSKNDPWMPRRRAPRGIAKIPSQCRTQFVSAIRCKECSTFETSLRRGNELLRKPQYSSLLLASGCQQGTLGHGAWGKVIPCALNTNAEAIRSRFGLAAVERVWHTQDSQGQILALVFRLKSVNPFKVLPLRSLAAFLSDSRAAHARVAHTPGLDHSTYRGSSLIRNPPPLGPYSRLMPRVSGGS